MFKNEITVVATSNRAPEELYKDGVQRDRFLPFIDLLNQQCPSLMIDSGIDYRFGGVKGAKTYFTPNNKENDEKLSINNNYYFIYYLLFV